MLLQERPQGRCLGAPISSENVDPVYCGRGARGFLTKVGASRGAETEECGVTNV